MSAFYGASAFQPGRSCNFGIFYWVVVWQLIHPAATWYNQDNPATTRRARTLGQSRGRVPWARHRTTASGGRKSRSWLGHVPNLNRAISILEFMASHQGCGISETAVLVPKDNVFRICTASFQGYLIGMREGVSAEQASPLAIR